MAKQKESFVIYYDWERAFQRLTDAQKGQLIQAIFDYEVRGELACGSGQLSFPLSGCVRSWLATDFSENMIAEARKRGETDRLCFCVADATALPFPDAHYDCAVIANALHIMPEPEQALREISRVLKPGGLLYAPTFLWAEKTASEVRRRLMELAGFKAYREWNLAQFRAFIVAQGYTVLKQELLESVPAPVGMLLARKQAQPKLSFEGTQQFHPETV